MLNRLRARKTLIPVALSLALMIALLEPTDNLMEAERENNFTRRLALLEEFKLLPAGIVFDEYCRRHDVPGAEWAAKL